MSTNVPGAGPPPGPRKGDQEFFTLIRSVRHDFRKLVQAMWPWGKEGTPLHDQPEPKKNQIEFLELLTEHQRANRIREACGLDPVVCQVASSGGRGAGKTAIEKMVEYACFSAYPGMTIIVSANNQDQLHNRTWAELAAWHTLALNSHWFERGSYSMRPYAWYGKKLEQELDINLGYYHMIGQLWDEARPEAFAGAHNPRGIIVNFQEAIGIPRPIWNVTKGFFAKKAELRLWLVSSNMRKNIGAFVECFRRNRSQWYGRMIDSRTVEGIDKNVPNSIVAEYGENSPEACAEVTGKIPGFSSRQAIALDAIERAMSRPLGEEDPGQAITIGVDVARFGTNKCTIYVRRGNNLRWYPKEEMRGQDTNKLLSLIITVINNVYEKTGIYPSAINVDATGVGGPTADLLKGRGFRNVYPIDFGAAAEEPTRYRNRRTEIYFRMKKWIDDGGCLPQDEELRDDLAGPEYGYAGDNSTMLLESKESMEARGLASPDDGDGACLTLATRVARLDLHTAGGGRPATRIADGVDPSPWYMDNS